MSEESKRDDSIESIWVQLADMVNLHFLNTMQALQSVNSALLCQLHAMWAPILTAYHLAVPHQLRLKVRSSYSGRNNDYPSFSIDIEECPIKNPVFIHFFPHFYHMNATFIVFLNIINKRCFFTKNFLLISPFPEWAPNSLVIMMKLKRSS